MTPMVDDTEGLERARKQALVSCSEGGIPIGATLVWHALQKSLSTLGELMLNVSAIAVQ